MSQTFIHPFESLDEHSADRVGGKGMNLGLLTRAGLPVPPGFCISTGAYLAALSRGLPLRSDDALRQQILTAYHAMGSPIVAVRSSATMEDGAAASFAGQQETILGVHGDEELIDAILRCWKSLHTERAIAYRRKQGIDDSLVTMAVVVQQLVESEVSGVLFTRDPLDPAGQRMMIEAAPGLGESVVAGSVMPDRFHTDRHSGKVLDQQIHSQATMHTKDGLRDIAPELRDKPCLTPEQLTELTHIGLKIEKFYGESRDVEWAWADGRVYILQARPITTAMASDVEAFRQTEIARLTARAENRGTIWAKYNLAEVLPHPTPMTWSIVRRFMSGKGGFGLMYRELGFDPDPALDEEGFIDLICGRPYVNLSREPMLFFRDFPYGYDFAKLKANPTLAIYPTPTADRRRATWRTWLRLPVIFVKMWLAGRRMKRRPAKHADHLRNEIFPKFVEQVKTARLIDLEKLSSQQLVDFVHEWIQRTLIDFAAQSLQPSMFAATALADVEAALEPILGKESARGEAQALMIGVRPDDDSDLAHALQALATARMTRERFLELFGHRGRSEMELASPRWSEDPSSLPAANIDASGSKLPVASDAPDRWPLLAEALMLDTGERKKLKHSIDRARTYLALRESSKHYLIMGMAMIRSALVELDRRFVLNEGIFHLEIEELPALIAGRDIADLKKRIESRRKSRKIAMSIEVPPVIFSDDLEAIGRAAQVVSAAEMKGTPVSFGVYEGQALVLAEPVPAESVAEGFVLVCSSTDPAWVPLFLKARALVMETGGVLSHGAIVAREFGIPAVAGISDVHRRLKSGQRIRVDGTTGLVHLFEEAK